MLISFAKFYQHSPWLNVDTCQRINININNNDVGQRTKIEKHIRHAYLTARIQRDTFVALSESLMPRTKIRFVDSKHVTDRLAFIRDFYSIIVNRISRENIPDRPWPNLTPRNLTLVRSLDIFHFSFFLMINILIHFNPIDLIFLILSF